MKDAQTENQQPKRANCKGPHVASYKGCPAYKKTCRHLHNMWWTVKNHMHQFYAKTRLPHNPRTRHSPFQPNKCSHSSRSPTGCYANPTHDAIDKKSSLCRRVSEAATNHLGDDVTGISLFDAIGQLRLSAPSASKPKTSFAKGETPFKLISSTKVIKPSAILKSVSLPPPPPPSSTNKAVPKQPKPFK